MTIRFALSISAFALMALFPGFARASADPSDRWLHAFVLLQTGRQLGERELWPLAMANYVTSLDYFEKLAEENPGYEPELVHFRIGDLKEKITRAGESMNVGDHDIAMHYADFIETATHGQELRYSLRYAESFPLLARAWRQISDLIEIRPDDLGPALAEQQNHFESIVEQTRDELLKDAEGARILNEIEKRLHFAGAITLIELPADPDVVLSPGLFPDTLTAALPGP